MKRNRRGELRLHIQSLLPQMLLPLPEPCFLLETGLFAKLHVLLPLCQLLLYFGVSFRYDFYLRLCDFTLLHQLCVMFDCRVQLGFENILHLHCGNSAGRLGNALNSGSLNAKLRVDPHKLFAVVFHF